MPELVDVLVSDLLLDEATVGSCRCTGPRASKSNTYPRMIPPTTSLPGRRSTKR